MDLYNGFIYWSHKYKAKGYKRKFSIEKNLIHRVNTNGEEFFEFKPHENYNGVFRIIHSSREPTANNYCAKANCTHLCLPLNLNTYRCLCPDNKLNNSNENCVEYV